jgi:hypothetical protein
LNRIPVGGNNELRGDLLKVLQYDEFIRAIAISKKDTFAFLLGAGCSISSGIPSAQDCIWDWKGAIYKSNNTNTNDWIDNYKNPKVQNVIQTWLDNQGGYVPEGSKDEYSFYAKKCFPIEKNRSQYFQNISSNAKPSIGYRTIPILVKYGFLDSIWTTNFDDLVLNACFQEGLQGYEIALDSVARIHQKTQNKAELPIIKLHGDFKFGDLKNTEEELKKQDETFRQKLIEYIKDKHLIVFGYSGRDNSLMNTLEEAYSVPGGGMLFWCGYHENNNVVVDKLIDTANKHGRNAYYIPTNGFDTTILNLAKLILDDSTPLKQELKKLQQIQTSRDTKSYFELTTDQPNKVLKSNCFPISFPNEVFVFEAELGEKPWTTVKELTLTKKDVSAIPYQRKVWAFGTITSVKAAFGESINSDIVRKPLTDTRVYHQGISFLLLSTLCKIFSTLNNVESDFRDTLWSNNYQMILGHKVFNGIKLSLEKMQNIYYIVLNPKFVVTSENIDKSIIQQIGLKFYQKIWNSKFNEYVDSWRKMLFSSNKYEFPYNSGSGIFFSIDKAPLFTDVCDRNFSFSSKHNVPQRLLKFKGVQFREAELTFSTLHGNKYAYDTHPMRGLLQYKPYETGLDSFLDSTISLGIVAPDQDTEILSNFLSLQLQEIPKSNPKDAYVIDFKGFYDIYGLSLNIPLPNSCDWEKLPEPGCYTYKENVHAIKQTICEKISLLCSVGKQKVIVVYIPERWEAYTSYNDNGESFDLHDYIKAFCVEKRVTSQFIRERTIKDEGQQCQINWWLSLAYYVKSLRTPWILKNADRNTAFAGIGYSIDSKDNDQGHVILGCSHIYSSSGEGLKYKLSKISNEKINWRHKKPHLNYDDSYEFGKNVINLFYESMNELPKRVVVHKRTFFTDEEKQGIIDSLLDNYQIESVDLIEINYEDDIKYVSSKIKNGRTEIDGYSVSRGTCIQIDSNKALLWAHGVVPSVQNPKLHFYPGGRYIPKPLKIIKHFGNGTLEQIANEILGLTKMNWNSLNMYSQLPATISSSNDIARIGKLIENKQKIEYDYRYFI